MTTWHTTEVTDWTAKRVVITGANSGIGLEAARVLVGHGATVVMACRDVDRGAAAAATIDTAGTGTGSTIVRRLDLADLGSVREFGQECVADEGPLAAFVANAGVMACPLSFTPDGFELQMGTNHFGHALLTSLLLPSMAGQGRVVFISSLAARGGKLSASMSAEDLTSPASYSAQGVYSNTKQANLLFAQELNRRIVAGDGGDGSAGADDGPTVIAAHPGVSATELFVRQLKDSGKGFLVPLARPALKIMLQSAKAGAWPTLRALSDPELHGGEFIGPRSLGQSRGAPEVLKLYPQGADEAAAARLWDLTEEILGSPILTPA